MEEFKLILDKHKIGWESPIIFLQGTEVITLSPLVIFSRVNDLTLTQRKAIINRFLLKSECKNSILNYINIMGSRILNIKI